MDGIPDIDRTQPAQNESMVGAPPPPSEVKIRTMRSDIAGIAQSGGGLPRFQNVKVEGLSIGRNEQNPQTPTAAHKSKALMMALITIAAVVVLGALLYFGYQLLATPK
jgi:hypothetical protein